MFDEIDLLILIQLVIDVFLNVLKYIICAPCFGDVIWRLKKSSLILPVWPVFMT